MNKKLILELYNYDSFVPEKFERWLNFEASPSLGKKTVDFPLWFLDGQETSLHEILKKSVFTIVEFGSFT